MVTFSYKQIKYFVGERLTDIDENNELDMSYMRQSAKIENIFYISLEPDVAVVSVLDINLVLPSPGLSGKTMRRVNIYYFHKKI